ncbi:hypothetical protein GF360_02935 [candidate division WWE3 bacterium]|nr:hypothetical protein [candidate division WWE3 bacterium]
MVMGAAGIGRGGGEGLPPMGSRPEEEGVKSIIERPSYDEMEGEASAEISEGTSEAAGSEETLELAEVHQLLLDSLEGVPTSEGVTEEQRAEMISRLSPNLVEELHGHLEALDYKQEYLGYDPIESHSAQLGVLRGELFERLLQTHSDEFFEELGIENYPLDTPLAEELLELLYKSERFGFERSGRNPDSAMVELVEEEGKKILGIKALVEAKCTYGGLDYRAFDQVTTFDKTVEDVWSDVARKKEALYRRIAGKYVERERSRGRSDFSMEVIPPPIQEQLRQVSEEVFVERHGLHNLVGFDEVRVDPDAQRIVVLPSNKPVPENRGDTAREDWLNLIATYDFRRPSDYEHFADLMETGEVTVAKAYFSYDEVEAMSKALLQQIQARY